MNLFSTRAYSHLLSKAAETKALAIASLITSLLVGCASAHDPNPDLSNILKADHRPLEHRQRDKYRNPQATLEFFELQPSHSVIEIWPGGKGWYTEILAPYLRPQGKLFAAHFSPTSGIKFFDTSLQSFKDKMAASPDIYDQVILTALRAPKEVDLANGTEVDRVLTFRNVHNWMKSGTAAETFAAFYKALKPGGILGVVEHRAPESFSISEMISSGYVSESQVKALAKQAGFVFLASSEINANAQDDKRHPRGVWTLPPSLRLGETDREKYLAIGESDRMTLKFVKPVH